MQSCGLDSPDSGWGPVAGSCKQKNTLFSSTKGRELLEWQNNCSLLQKGFVPWGSLLATKQKMEISIKQTFFVTDVTI